MMMKRSIYLDVAELRGCLRVSALQDGLCRSGLNQFRLYEVRMQPAWLPCQEIQQAVHGDGPTQNEG